MFSMAHSVLVFPCRQDKSPATKHGFKDASSDPAVIREMFADAHAEYVAMPTGSITGVSVLRKIPGSVDLALKRLKRACLTVF